MAIDFRSMLGWPCCALALLLAACVDERPAQDASAQVAAPETVAEPDVIAVEGPLAACGSPISLRLSLARPLNAPPNSTLRYDYRIGEEPWRALTIRVLADDWFSIDDAGATYEVFYDDRCDYRDVERERWANAPPPHVIEVDRAELVRRIAKNELFRYDAITVPPHQQPDVTGCDYTGASHPLASFGETPTQACSVAIVREGDREPTALLTFAETNFRSLDTLHRTYERLALDGSGTTIYAFRLVDATVPTDDSTR